MAKKRKSSRPSPKAGKKKTASKKKTAQNLPARSGEETTHGPRKLHGSRLPPVEGADAGAHRAVGQGQGPVASGGERSSRPSAGVGRAQCRVSADDDSPHSVSPSPRVRRTAVQFRRSPHLVAYWRNGSLRICNYATQTTVDAGHLVCELLDFCNDWRTLEDTRARGCRPDRRPNRGTGRPTRDSLTPPTIRSPWTLGSAPWTAWAVEPGGGLLSHGHARRGVQLAARGRALPPSDARSRVGAAGAQELPRRRAHRSAASRDRREFPQVLRARRTWRRYSSTPVRLDELATMLGLGGVQQWVQADGHMSPEDVAVGRRATPDRVLRRRPRRAGAEGGIYHYASDRHSLEKLRGPVPIQRMRAYMPSSEYFANASAMVFFTAVFERILWRYPYCAGLSRGAHRGRPRLPDVLPDGDPARPRALQRHGAGGFRDRAGPRHRRHLRIGPVCRRRRTAPTRATWAPLPKGANPKLRRNPRSCRTSRTVTMEPF